MSKINNPVLKGFNPDPSIIRVEDDYYIATSTFEWLPGVQIHHSKDMVNWTLHAHAVTRKDQIDMIGNPNSGGVWAPCLSYDNGTFYLIYTDVKSLVGAYKDTHNYLITAKDIKGPWSSPVYLNSSGFDPSLFHDDDGRKWLVNMVWDHRKGRNPFGGILMQEYSEEERKLVGPIHNIFKGSPIGLTEAPHLYKKDGWYYLMTAEGGTEFNHAVTMARSKSLFGPYEIDPKNPMLTSCDKPDLRLQRAGHASLVQTQHGDWYIAHLCGRPLLPEVRCNLGRETAIQKCYWDDDGWLRIEGGGNSPRDEVDGPGLPLVHSEAEREKDDFDDEKLSKHYSSLREFISEEWATLKERPGYLRMVGRESLNSVHRQSLIARRQQSFIFEAETAVEFEPDTFQQMAGLVYYYNTENYYYLRISHDEELGKTMAVYVNNRGRYDEILESDISIEGLDRCYLKVAVTNQTLQFYYSSDGEEWLKIGKELDASKLSDEYAVIEDNGYFRAHAFTGAFVGICVQDLSGTNKEADFDYFIYKEFE